MKSGRYFEVGNLNFFLIVYGDNFKIWRLVNVVYWHCILFDDRLICGLVLRVILFDRNGNSPG